LPPSRHFGEDDAALELAAAGFAAVLAFQRDPIDRNRDIAAFPAMSLNLFAPFLFRVAVRRS
jgi:hypothetical protein